ncbi:hypothetical protein HK28_13990 [Acetobacter sp. DsW_063]|nr:hypothetical protein HK28_13990 [Acetobacter sp. DsW_063]
MRLARLGPPIRPRLSTRPPPGRTKSTKTVEISRFSRLFDDRRSDRSGSRRLGRVARPAKQLDVRRIERSTAVFQFVDVVTEQASSRPSALLAGPATLLDQATHEIAPGLRKVEGVSPLGRRDRDAGVY